MNLNCLHTEGHRGGKLKNARLMVISMVVILLVNLMAGCTVERPDDDVESIKITDGLGREVGVEVGAKRVISLAPSVTEIVYALGLGSRVVAVDNNTNYPVEAMDKTKVSGYKWLDIETILGLGPDLVIGAHINKDDVTQLEERGLVERKRSSTDRRAVQVILTQKGHDLLRVHIPLLRCLLERTIGTLSLDERHSLAAISQKLGRAALILLRANPEHLSEMVEFFTERLARLEQSGHEN